MLTDDTPHTELQESKRVLSKLRDASLGRGVSSGMRPEFFNEGKLYELRNFLDGRATGVRAHTPEGAPTDPDEVDAPGKYDKGATGT